MHDPGDEHVDAPARPNPFASLDALLADVPCFDEFVFWRMVEAESARDCCRGCALDVNGEDGS